MSYIVPALLLIVILSYGHARRMLVDSLDYVVASLVLLLTLCGFFFLVYLGWRYIARHLAIPFNINMPLHFNFMDHLKVLQIISPAAILSAALFVILIIILKQRMAKWREKTNGRTSMHKPMEKR